MQITLAFLILLLGTAAESVRILGFFQLPSPSHHFIFKPILEELAKRGHEIVYVTPFPYDQPPEGITQIVLPVDDYEEEFGVDWIQIGELNIFEAVKVMFVLGELLAPRNLWSNEVQDLIHSDQKFDIVLLEPDFGQEYLSALIHKFNAIGIDIICLGDHSWVNELAGLPDNPAYQLDFMSEIIDFSNFRQRLYNTYVTMVTSFVGYYTLNRMQVIMDRYFNYTGWEKRPTVDVLVKNRSLILVNFDNLLGHPYPVPPHRKDIGGINIKPTKALPKMFMDGSKEGVIYMSLGTIVKPTKLSDEIGHFISVFRKLPQRVLLKIETKYPGELPPNVRMEKWFPQQDILAHNNCALFITHGGLLSVTEAVYHGIPLVGIPFFGDQPKNVIFAESAGFGKMLRYRNITRETVLWTIHEVLSNRRYKDEAVRRSKIFRNRRHTPAEEAAYWIEHSLKYPFSLTPKAVSLSPVKLHLIDINIVITSVLLAIMYSIYVITVYIKKRLFLNRKRKLKLN